MRYEIRGLSFLEEGVSLEFINFDNDVKVNGAVLNHALLVPDNSDYHDGIMALRTAAIELLDDVMDDWPRLETLAAAVAADEGPSPYDNPLERDLPGGAS